MGALAATVGVGILGSVLSSRENRRAQRSQEQGQQRAINAQDAQSAQSRADFSPFLQAATGGNRGALNQLIEGIDQAPVAPQIDQFNLKAVPSVEIQQFGQGNQLQQFNPGAPLLQDFNFDPSQALNNPALQFQKEQGEIQLDRIAGKNRKLNSGQRLIDAVEFGQGLASQSLGDEFNRQLTINDQNNQVAQQGFVNQGTINQLKNRITGQNNQIDQNNTALRNSGLVQQQSLDRKNLSDTLNLSNVNQNRLLQQFGLEDARFNNRLDRLSGIVNVGAGAGSALSNAGSNSANNISNNILQSQGATQAAGQIGRSNIRNDLLTQGFRAAGQFGLFNQQPDLSSQFGTTPGSQQTNQLLQQQAGF